MAVSTRSVMLDTLVVGLAAVEGDSAELWGVQPASDRDRMPFCPIAWCWSLVDDKKRQRMRFHCLHVVFALNAKLSSSRLTPEHIRRLL